MGVATSQETLSIEEAAAYIGKSRGTIYKLLRNGELVKSEKSKRPRIEKASLDEYVRLYGLQVKTPTPRKMTVSLDEETLSHAKKFGLVISNKKGELVEISEAVKLAIKLAALNRDEEGFISKIKEF